MRSGRVAGVAVVVGIWSATGWGYPGLAAAETPGAQQGTEQGADQGTAQAPTPEAESESKPEVKKPERRVAPRTVPAGTDQPARGVVLAAPERPHIGHPGGR